MKMTASNLVSKTGNETIRFVVWSRQGEGMVEVGSPGSCGDMMTLEGARNYWKQMVEKWGYKKAPATTVEPY
jgi:hypothetical protein